VNANSVTSQELALGTQHKPVPQQNGACDLPLRSLFPGLMPFGWIGDGWESALPGTGRLGLGVVMIVAIEAVVIVFAVRAGVRLI
jgi:hypothetical protein